MIAIDRPMQPRLMIAVPTFNRAGCLRILLHTLECELRGLSDRVAVLVLDNASADDTPQVLREFAARLPWLAVVRHAGNVGPDENFAQCIERSQADYVWLMGDDDLPRAGVLALLLELLDRESPDLVNLASRGRARLDDNDPGSPARDLAVRDLDRVTFARQVNVRLTFISGVVLRRATFVADATPAQLRRYIGTNLIQLSWVLGTLALGRRFLEVATVGVLATSGNSGGYGLLKVFGETFPAIVREHFGAGSAVAEAMVTRYQVEFIPAQLWHLRSGDAGDFRQENPTSALRPQLGRSLFFPILLAIGWAPRPVAHAIWRLSWLLARGLRVGDRLRAAFARRP